MTHEETVEHEGVRVAMLPLGESRVELLEPLGPETVVGRFLSKRGPGLHHVAVHVDDIEAAWKELQARGSRWSHRQFKLVPAAISISSCIRRARRRAARNLPGPGVMIEYPVLAFDTCGETGTVALVDLGNGAVAVTCIAQTELGGRTASAQLMPAITALLRDSGLDLQAIRALVVVNGPGSFTGIRVGLSTAKGLAHAAGYSDGCAIASILSSAA